jgi:Na+/proline symporter
MGLHIADYAVLGLYFLFLLVIGYLESKKIKISKDFFMPQKFGKIFMLTFSFGAGTHADQAVGVSSKSFTNGLSGIWYQWLYLFATPFYWLIAPVMRRFRAITMSDVFQCRFNRSVGILFAIVGMWNLTVMIGLMLKGSAEVLSSSAGSLISVKGTIAIMTVMFVIYGVAGGLSAAIIIGFVQGVLIVIFSFILLPLVLYNVGGFEGFRQKLTDPQMLSLIAPADIGFFYIFVLALNGLVGIVTQPHVLANCAAGKSELDGQVGFMGGNMLKRLVTIPWCFTGVVAVVYFAGRTVDPDKVFGTLANEFLPQIFPGALGIFIAGIMSAVMNACGTFMLSSSALFTENVYKPIWPKKEQKHYILVGRIASVVVVAGGVLFAYWLPGVVKGLEIFWMVSAMMALAFWLGLFWRRTTVAGAWAATLVSVAVWWLTTQPFCLSWLNSLPMNETLKFVVTKGTRLEIYLPWQMTFYLVIGTIAGIVVSLFTKPVSEEKLDNFYALIRTPIVPGEKILTPCTLPPGTVPAPRRNLFPSKNLEIMVPSRTSVIGFLVGWVCAAVLIWIVYWIANM